MNIEGKEVLILGGAGMVGMAVARELLKESPARIVIHSLREAEVRDALAALEAEQTHQLEIAGILDSRLKRRVRLAGDWGNLFVRMGLHEREPSTLMDDPEARRAILEDVTCEFGEAGDAGQSKGEGSGAEKGVGSIAGRFYLYDLLRRHKPDLVVDTVNTATGIAYGDVYSVASEAVRRVREADAGDPRSVQRLQEITERLVATDYVPQLVRHVQILYKGMKDAGTSFYVKVGTSGTGGMGLNIPYTHGEERPSRVLLSKSAIAGAHTLLLFLQARTPDSPITKEIKPAAAIAWKKYGYGEIRRRGAPIVLEDAVAELVADPKTAPAVERAAVGAAFGAGAGAAAGRTSTSAAGMGGGTPTGPATGTTADTATGSTTGTAAATSEAAPRSLVFDDLPAASDPLDGLSAEPSPLKAVYVDTGENGLFSVDEFVAISTAGQMEFVTPEEIARNLIAEVKGDNTGKDVITSLNIACMGPTYRAGFSRHYLLDKLRALQADHELAENDNLAMAFEVLGPPRLSKLLYEAYLLKLCTAGMEDVAQQDAAELARRIHDRIFTDSELRKKILSIGIPILAEREGTLRLLRGRRMAVPKDGAVDLTDSASREAFAEAGWVDLRERNWARWILRMRAILKEMQGIPAHETSSRHLRDRAFWGAHEGSAGIGQTAVAERTPIDAGEVAGWIFNTEDRGQRGRE